MIEDFDYWLACLPEAESRSCFRHSMEGSDVKVGEILVEKEYAVGTVVLTVILEWKRRHGATGAG